MFRVTLQKEAIPPFYNFAACFETKFDHVIHMLYDEILNETIMYYSST